jgi:hypothetical protein
MVYLNYFRNQGGIKPKRSGTEIAVLNGAGIFL